MRYHILKVIVCSVLLLPAITSGINAEETTKSPAAVPDTVPYKLNLDVTLSEGYTDNVFSTKNDKQGDLITVIAPQIDLSRKTDKMRFTIGAEAEIGRYADNTSENYVDTQLRAEGDVKLGTHTKLFGGADYSWEHEERSSADGVGGSEPTEYEDGSAYAGISTEFDNITLRLGGNLRNYDFKDTPASGGGSVNNDDRDRLQSEFGTRIGYRVSPNRELFIQGIYETRDYDTAVDDAGFDRNSNGIQLAIGAAGKVGNVKGEILLGLLSQDYDDPAFDRVTTYDIGADISWRPTPGTRLHAIVERRIEETTLSGSSGYVATTGGLRLRHRVAPDLSASGHLFLTENDYESSSQTDYITETGIGIRYHLTPNFYIGGDYNFEQRSSNEATEDYDTHSLFLRLGAELNPAYKEGARLASLDDSGFYVGMQGGHGGLGTALDGPRGGGGTVTTDFGNYGFQGGVLGGYRARYGKLALGVELDAEILNTNWSHNADRTYSVDANDSIGLSGIIGYQLQNDVLLYGRAGVVGTEFETNYDDGSDVGKRTKREVGMRLGAGAEFPLSGAFSGRMEYVISAYPDYEGGAIMGGGDDDNFANMDNLTRIALIYNFGQSDPDETKAPVDFSGFYAGASFGHGMMGSDNYGPRPNAAAPSFYLDVDRADQGVSGGLYGGYGQAFGKFYLGAELEAEMSGANWNIERDPNGRIYSVDKNATLGAGLRLGYIANDAVLIYGRAGLVNSWFNTDYTVGAGTVSQDDSQLGIRYGGGVEFALNKSLRMRLDYTHTQYSIYSVTYASGTDTFDNSENMFRLGLAHQF